MAKSASDILLAGVLNMLERKNNTNNKAKELKEKFNAAGLTDDDLSRVAMTMSNFDETLETLVSAEIIADKFKSKDAAQVVVAVSTWFANELEFSSNALDKAGVNREELGLRKDFSTGISLIRAKADKARKILEAA